MTFDLQEYEIILKFYEELGPIPNIKVKVEAREDYRAYEICFIDINTNEKFVFLVPYGNVTSGITSNFSLSYMTKKALLSLGHSELLHSGHPELADRIDKIFSKNPEPEKPKKTLNPRQALTWK